jgi:HPt (histidine-containing phosphotransfer) domain-containing protein
MSRTFLEAQILDLDHLGRQTFGDIALERELLALFEQQCVRLSPILVAHGPPIERADAAHTLKGSARAVGAWRLASLAETLERVLDDGEPEDVVERLVAKLEKAIANARSAASERWRAAAA